MQQTNHYHELGEAGNRPGNPYQKRFVIARPFAAIPIAPNHFNFKRMFKAVISGGASEVAANKKVQAVVKNAIQAPKTLAAMVKKQPATPMVPQTMARQNVVRSIKQLNPL